MRRFYDVDKKMEREMVPTRIKTAAASPEAAPPREGEGENHTHHIDLGSPIVTNNATAGISLKKKLAAEEAARNQFSEGFMDFCRSLAPILSTIMFIIMFFWLIMVSGTSGGSERPKVAIVVFEGFRGDIFQSAVLNSNKAPLISALLQADVSSYSTCTGIDDYKCARTQSGPALGPDHTFGAAPGITSILTGVNAQRHLVSNNSAMAHFTATSKTYPSLPKHLKNLGLKTAAVGTSKLISTINGEDDGCIAHGVLDYECGSDVAFRCYESSDCNLNARVPTEINGELGHEEEHMMEGIETALASNPDLLIFHTAKLARGAEDPSRPLFSFDAKSPEYLAEVYQLDAIIGQLAAELRERSKRYRENWLLIGTSATGGYGKVLNYDVSGYDEIIPFFVVPLTTSPLRVKALNTPASQMDVYPTALKWLGVAGPANITLDGQAQGICTNGLDLQNCTSS